MGLIDASDKLVERQLGENLDDLQVKRDRLNLQQAMISSSDYCTSLTSHLHNNWDDVDSWAALAQLYEKKQK